MEAKRSIGSVVGIAVDEVTKDTWPGKQAAGGEELGGRGLTSLLRRVQVQVQAQVLVGLGLVRASRAGSKAGWCERSGQWAVGIGGAHWSGWVQMATVRPPTGTGAIGPGIARRGAVAAQWQAAKDAARGASVRLGRLASQCEWAVLH